jgi:hypothetical protein
MLAEIALLLPSAWFSPVGMVAAVVEFTAADALAVPEYR